MRVAEGKESANSAILSSWCGLVKKNSKDAWYTHVFKRLCRPTENGH